MTIFGINLMALGVVMLACSGIFCAIPAQLANLPRMNFETSETHVIPPVVGALALVSGIALLIMNPQRAAGAASKPGSAESPSA